MTRFTRNDAAAAALVGGTSLITALCYSRLPASVPIHFDLHGHADGYSSRAVGAWLLIGSSVGLWALLRLGGSLLPASWRERLELSPTSAVALVVVALFSALQLGVLYAALHPEHSLGISLVLLLGITWIVLGQVLPRVRRNPWIGIRTTWTLTSDENWARTQRFGAWMFTAAGLVACLGALLHRPVVAGVAVGVSVVVPVLYSWVLARRGT